MPWLPVAPVTRITFFILNQAFDFPSDDEPRELRDRNTLVCRMSWNSELYVDFCKVERRQGLIEMPPL